MITGVFALDWLLISVSLFNTMLLLWLALTVLLNAERRTWGVYAMGGGFLAGSAFFFSHTIILASEFSYYGVNLNFWWRAGWFPIIIAPFAWYLVTLWYSGFWHHPFTPLHYRHRFWLICLGIVAAVLFATLVFFNPIPSYSQLIALDTASILSGTTPLLLVIFPAFMVLCILLSVDALCRPEPATRMMGNLARQRSRPWLIATAATLLAVSLLVVYFILRLIGNVSGQARAPDDLRGIVLFDLVLASMIAVATLLLGQAIVSYEVFTGKTLPRRGFFRHWQTAIALAGGCSLLVGWSVAIQMRALYGLMMMTVLIVGLFALFGWRSFAEREQFMIKLRPFVRSQRLIHHLLDGENEAIPRAGELFAAVCHDILNTQHAQLIPMGSLAPLAGQTLCYPPNSKPKNLPPPYTLFSTETNIVALPSDQYSEFLWAIPLWAERGLIGALLVDKKVDGGLYTQEEVEIARATGERIVDMLAGEHMAQRLMTLQRKRLAEYRVMDLRTRRILHDETLPALHTAVLSLSGLSHDNPALRGVIDTLTEVHKQISDLIHTTPKISATTRHGDLSDTIRTLVNNEFAGEFTRVHWHIAPNLPAVEMLAQEVIVGAVREVIRNAAIHGRGGQAERRIVLSISLEQTDEALIITVEDDGVGLDYPHHADNGGSGGGLALHSTMLAVIGGYLSVSARQDGGTQVVITVPHSEQKMQSDPDLQMAASQPDMQAAHIDGKISLNI